MRPVHCTGWPGKRISDTALYVPDTNPGRGIIGHGYIVYALAHPKTYTDAEVSETRVTAVLRMRSLTIGRTFVIYFRISRNQTLRRKVRCILVPLPGDAAEVPR